MGGTRSGGQGRSGECTRGDNTLYQSRVPRDLGTTTHLAAAGDTTCAVNTEGEITCWGEFIEGQDEGSAAVGVPSRIALNNHHMCLLDDMGRFACWGRGDNDVDQVPVSTDVEDFAISESNGCAALAAGGVACWGGNRLDWLQPAVDALGSPARVAPDGNMFCAIASDRTVTCSSEFAHGITSVPGGLTDVIDIELLNGGACALQSTGTIPCWGNFTPFDLSAPATIVDAVQFDLSHDGGCATRSNGQVQCWGDLAHAQFMVPADLPEADAVAIGSAHTCALTRAGEVRCWGISGRGTTTVPESIQL